MKTNEEKNNRLYKEVWGIPNVIKANCYVFALAPSLGPGGYNTRRKYKARPGDLCVNFRNKPIDFTKCSDIVERVLCDNRQYVRKLSTYTNPLARLSKGYHMIAAILSPGIHTDFHFLRRIPVRVVYENLPNFIKTSMGTNAIDQLLKGSYEYVWVHQRGWSSGGPLIHDANGNLITDPKTASFDYGSLNYSIYCGLFQVKTRYAKVYDYIK
jgi:hypothetical protein